MAWKSYAFGTLLSCVEKVRKGDERAGACEPVARAVLTK